MSISFDNCAVSGGPGEGNCGGVFWVLVSIILSVPHYIYWLRAHIFFSVYVQAFILLRLLNTFYKGSRKMFT